MGPRSGTRKWTSISSSTADEKETHVRFFGMTSMASGSQGTALGGAWKVHVTLLFAAGIAACTEPPPPPTAEIIRPVRYLDVVAEDATVTRVFSGSAEADEEVDISFKVAGTLRERPVTVGDRVEPGDLLGKLDGRDFSVAVKEAEARLARAIAEVRNADSNYERARELYENDNVSKSELGTARATAESAEALVRVARQSLTDSRLQLSYTEIRAPEACEVAQTFMEVNENVTSGQPIVRLNCGACPDVRVSVPETQIGSIKVGNPASVVFGAIPGRRFRSIVDEVGVAMSAHSMTFTVVVEVVEDCDLIRSGMAADVEFRIPSAFTGQRIRVPWVAVGEDRNGRYVFVLESGDDTYAIARRRPIEIADTTGDSIIIESGLAPGDRIVTAGVRRISDRQKVKLYGVGP
jgi:membrane fusion protein, multidrug efflux system